MEEKIFDFDDEKGRLQEKLEKLKKRGITCILVEADPEKGFSYPYLLAYPSDNIGSTIVMDSLNDYEDLFENNELENQSVMESIYDLWEDDRVRTSSPLDMHGMVEESSDKTQRRGCYRLDRALQHLDLVCRAFQSAPIMMPLIPGFNEEPNSEYDCSWLNEGSARELAPQLIAMISHARDVICTRNNITLDEQIIAYGHSKESQFADHFTTLHPEIVKSLIVGGKEEAAFPISELRLILDDETPEMEAFEVREGISYKRVSTSDFDRIRQEYEKNKRDFQRNMTQNEDGSYTLPLNYPVGIDDIDHYRDFPDQRAREEYIRTLREIPRMMFIGENEEKVTYVEQPENDGGSYSYIAYSRGKTQEGRDVEMGEFFSCERFPINDIELSSEHNVIFDQYNITKRLLFGKGVNERLRRVVEFYNTLGINVQSKIYPGVGHRDMYHSEELSVDLSKIYKSVDTEDAMPRITGGEDRTNPTYQLLRRLVTSRNMEFAFFVKNEIEHTLPGTLDKLRTRLADMYRDEGGIISEDRFYDNLPLSAVQETVANLPEYSRIVHKYQRRDRKVQSKKEDHEESPDRMSR